MTSVIQEVQVIHSPDIEGKSKIGGKLTAKDVIIEASSRRGRLKVKEINASGEVYLENTFADVVRGKRVKIGEGCEIGEVIEE